MVLAQRTSVHLYGDMMVWYHMFVIFVMYCMLPVPVKGRMHTMDGTFRDNSDPLQRKAKLI